MDGRDGVEGGGLSVGCVAAAEPSARPSACLLALLLRAVWVATASSLAKATRPLCTTRDAHDPLLDPALRLRLVVAVRPHPLPDRV